MLNLLIRSGQLVTGGSRLVAASVAFDLIALAALDVVQLVCLHRIVADPSGRLIAPVAGLVITALASGAWMKHLFTRVQGAFTAFAADYTDDVLHRLASLNLMVFEHLDRTRVESTLRTDLEQFRRFAYAFIELLRGALVGALYVVYMLLLAPKGALIVFLWLAALVSISVGWAAAWRRHARTLYQSRDAFVRQARAVLGGAREVGLHRPRSEALWSAVEGCGREHRAVEREIDRQIARHRAWMNISTVGLFGIVAFVVPLLSTRGDQVAAGLMAIALLSVRYAMLLARGMSGAVSTVPLLERLDQLLADLPMPNAQASAMADPPTEVRTIELRGVRIRHPDQPGRRGFELGPIDLEVHAGRALFIIGPNGSGKSTLLKGLCGLYPLIEGEARVDGVPLNPQSAAWRALFSVAFADPVVHRRLYGLDPKPAEVEALLAQLGLTDKVHLRDGAFDTIDLSTGQRKRLSLVLCLLQNRPVLLLDEWAADQDPVFRARFYEVLLPALKAAGKALVVISHDDAFFERADDTLRLDGGRRVER
ncbi:MAG: ATP-binding cassette domain-containing protein [Myxococcales bacterium]|nr:ATP-binding cassette domain-containing protein [Myxococcales bacterium]